jgi:hypothetical protein
MRKKKVEGEYQTDSWPKGPESSLCPLARPDIAMGPESQIEAWSVRVYDASRPLVRIARSHLTAEEQQRCQKQKPLVIVSGAITLLSVVGDSDVRVKDTEVGEEIPLTSPFIEGIYGMSDAR